jgi:hypothetical protein
MKSGYLELSFVLVVASDVKMGTMASLREFAGQAGLSPRRLLEIESGTGEPANGSS